LVTGIIAVALGYLLGSIPMAYIVGHLKKGGDIRQMGGGNMGALNTMREVGMSAGIAVLIIDIAKGSVAVLIARWLGLSPIWIFIAGFAAIAGHNWPVFLGFRGGRGAATTLGVLLVLVPLELAISLVITAIVLVITSNVRLGLAAGLALLPLIIWQINGSGLLIVYSLALAFFLGVRALLDLRKTMLASDTKKGLIFDKQYHFWQSRKR
jgi:glycerol-3-phosphate acyltransferase PlsY